MFIYIFLNLIYFYDNLFEVLSDFVTSENLGSVYESSSEEILEDEIELVEGLDPSNHGRAV